jgi:hypothetical protein
MQISRARERVASEGILAREFSRGTRIDARARMY